MAEKALATIQDWWNNKLVPGVLAAADGLAKTLGEALSVVFNMSLDYVDLNADAIGKMVGRWAVQFVLFIPKTIATVVIGLQQGLVEVFEAILSGGADKIDWERLEGIYGRMLSGFFQGVIEEVNKQLGPLVDAVAALLERIFNAFSQDKKGGGRGAGLQSLAQDTGGALDGMKEAAGRVVKFLDGGWKTTLDNTFIFLRDSLRPQITNMNTIDLPGLGTAATTAASTWLTLFDAALRSTSQFISATLVPVIGYLGTNLSSDLIAAMAIAQSASASLAGYFGGLRGSIDDTTSAVWRMIAALNAIPGRSGVSVPIPGSGRTMQTVPVPNASRSMQIIVSNNTFGNRQDVDYLLAQLDRRLRLEGGILPI
jgi:hypothetical protein